SLLLSTLSAQQQAPTVRTLIGEDRSARRVATVAAAVLAARGFEARVTNGIDVAHTGRSVALVHWVEVLFDSRWIAFSVANGLPRLPDGYVPLWRGRTPMAVIDGGTLDTRRIAVQRLSRNELDQALLRGTEAGSTLVDFSLYILPTSVQALYRILLTVPIGVFILVILRNLIGIKGLGSFMPVLIALAFRETTLVWGIVLFVMIVSAGLAVRLYLEHLKLLLAPRLGAILMVVILMMAVVSVVAHKLGFDRGLSIALFPMVILTMTIERVSILWDERGPAAAMREAMQSLTIAALCYLAMSLPALQYLFFTFPELILVLLALTLLIGRYAGYRLLELPRFRAIIGDRSS
ncbi:MAG: hypothetical protein H6934_14230, partial [Burkholderiaceae bacterium]|nr:hypothetical protein [Burkholderiaceae bacterium]